MAQVAPMLSQLGYDPNANPPNYGSPDAFVADNTRRIKQQSKLWEEKAQELFHIPNIPTVSTNTSPPTDPA